MAQRLATNYASACFTMSEEELDQFVKLFANENIKVQVKICDNGDRDIILVDKSGEIQLSFQRSGNRYSCESSYLIKDLQLANAMRKAMKKFRGHAVVHRIYDHFTVVYHYDEGSVISIHEVTEDGEVSIFENHGQDLKKELECLFNQKGAEEQIAMIRSETDKWLDLRNWAKRVAPQQVSSIDERLAELARRLVMLEA
ncbi:hypothetical protein G3578_00560 [Brevibacillus sp. SYP-B805]|uniref:hypothetical protein n=1 Tax=Brevibacillus sp. SYP-B805 TaxID=1578199 RepID=UPI0013EE1556|nr:hypothetical protein [Brevibacillus sp. SYP-B805]NGQ93659.1 hypothetical protein [Brevibacillus sp. SYP-B805]